MRVKRDGVNVPGVLGVDAEAGWLVLEFIGGGSVRAVLDSWVECGGGGKGANEQDDKEVVEVMRQVGREVGKLHALGVCHGDLTTSNILLRKPDEDGGGVQQEQEGTQKGRQTTSTLREAAMSGAPPPLPPPPTPIPVPSFKGTVYLIDFGLTTASIQDEDKAVDLYVLERAFAATHPKAEWLFREVLEAYAGSYKGGKGVVKRLEGVRLRGRKRSMLG